MKKTETIHVTGMAPFTNQISLLAQHNPLFDQTQKELEDQGLAGERIYQDLYPCENAAFLLEPQTGLVQVTVTGQQVGYVRKAECVHVKELIEKNSITNVSVTMHGGPYRILMEGEEDTFTVEEGCAAMFAIAEITYEEADQTPAPESGDSGMHYISTTYDTQTLDDSGRRGNAPLVLAILVAGFYLGFFIPYWIMVRRGMATPIARLGGDISNNLLNPHLAIVGGALLVTIIALVTKNALWPQVAALLYFGSCWKLPGMAIFVAIPALLCILSAFRRKSKVFVTILKILALLAVLAAGFWLLKPTAMEVWNDHKLVIRPTGNETFDFENSSSDDDMMDYDEGDYVDFGDDFSDEFDAEDDYYNDDEDFYDDEEDDGVELAFDDEDF